MSIRAALASLVLSAVAALPAHAVVQYSFSGFNSEGLAVEDYSNPVSFTLTVADFITSDSFFEPAALDACSNGASACRAVRFKMDGTDYGAADHQVIEFSGVTQTSLHYFVSIPALPFSTPGTYATDFSFNPGSLTVTAIPEPASTALLLGGLAAVGAAVRRRRAG